MSIKELLTSEIKNEESFQKIIQLVYTEITNNEIDFSSKVPKFLNEILKSKSIGEKNKYYTLHILNLCILLNPHLLTVHFELYLKNTLLCFALFEPKNKNISEKAIRFFKNKNQKFDENYAVYFFELLLECIEFWHVNDENNDNPVFKDMYCEIVKNKGVFIDEPSHVLIYLEYLENIKQVPKKTAQFDLTKCKKSFTNSLESSKIKSINFKESIIEKTTKNSDFPEVMNCFIKTLNIIISFVFSKHEKTQLLFQLISKLEESIQQASDFKHLFTKTELDKLKDGLFILNSFLQFKNYQDFRKTIIEKFPDQLNYIKDEENCSNKPSLCTSYTLSHGSIANFKSKSISIQPHKNTQSQNCILNFQRSSSIKKEILSSGTKINSLNKINSPDKINQKIENKSAESLKEAISFRSFEIDKNESTKKSQIENQKISPETTNFFAQFIQNERKELKSKIKNLKYQILSLKTEHQLEIESLQIKLKNSESSISNLQDENKRLSFNQISQNSIYQNRLSSQIEVKSFNNYIPNSNLNSLNNINTIVQNQENRISQNNKLEYSRIFKEPINSNKHYELIGNQNIDVSYSTSKTDFSLENKLIEKTKNEVLNIQPININFINHKNEEINIKTKNQNLDLSSNNNPDFLKLFHQEIDGILNKNQRIVSVSKDPNNDRVQTNFKTKTQFNSKLDQNYIGSYPYNPKVNHYLDTDNFNYFGTSARLKRDNSYTDKQIGYSENRNTFNQEFES